MRGGRGVAAAFVRSGEPAWRLGWLTLKAHLALAPALPGLWRARRAIMESRRVTPAAFRAMLEEHRLSLKEVASQ
jgi:hypothetical protein